LRGTGHLRDFILRPALNQHGYDILGADNDSDPGSISTAMVTSIIESPLVVADLTDRNPNVNYQLAIAHAYRIPVIHMIWEGGRAPFDLTNMRRLTTARTTLRLPMRPRSVWPPPWFG